MNPNESGFPELFQALGRLDQLLERATRAADAAYGGTAATDPYRGLYIAPQDVPRMLARAPGTPLLAADPAVEPITWDRMQVLGRRFDLDSFDCAVLLLALAPEIDLRYERLYAYLQDDVTRRRPSVDLALNLLCASREAKLNARERFAPASPMVRHKLIHLLAEGTPASPPLLACTLKVDESVLRFLLRHVRLDGRFALHSEWVDPAAAAGRKGASSAPLIGRLVEMTREAETSDRPLRLLFEGAPQSLKKNTALGLAARLGFPVIVCDLARMPTGAQEFQDALDLVFREARLHEAQLHFENADSLLQNRVPLLLFAERISRRPADVHLLTMEGERAAPLRIAGLTRIPFPEADYPERRRAWQEELALRSLPVSAIDDLAAVYRIGPDEIREAAVAAHEQGRLTGQPVQEHDVRLAAQAQACRELGPLAQRVAPANHWEDLVLPPDQVAQLREISAHARFRYKVYGEWGFDQKLALGKGLSALFSGPPGTGKTMAAEVIATDLYLDLYRIDLSQVVSKYIGETEKNLATVFREARAGSCILFFDECDALFGKRTETKDAHDRYANLEIAYLLQKIDEYEGLCILATNLRQNLDPAFVRRLTFIVEFPFPDSAERRRIWETIWPRQIPKSPDLDLDFIASRFKLSGGSVKNVAIGAAFLAAAERSTDIRTMHVLRAVRREIEKSGRTLTRVDLGAYADRPEFAELMGVARGDAVEQSRKRDGGGRPS